MAVGEGHGKHWVVRQPTSADWPPERKELGTSSWIIVRECLEASGLRVKIEGDDLHIVATPNSG
jgi:hypothetical protein